MLCRQPAHFAPILFRMICADANGAPIFERLISTAAPGFARGFRYPWHDIRIADAGGHRRNISSVSRLGAQMGEVIQFIPRSGSDKEAARLIREARAIYEAIFPTQIANVTPSGEDDTSP
jgi:hypothetical protein